MHYSIFLPASKFDFGAVVWYYEDMKKLLLLLFVLSGTIFALTDTDRDGVTDDKDTCPRVYSRSENGCPALSPKSSFVLNTCILEASKKSIILTLTPVCDKNASCPEITQVSGIQACDAIFPVIFDSTGKPLIRWGIFVVGFTR